MKLSGVTSGYRKMSVSTLVNEKGRGKLLYVIHNTFLRILSPVCIFKLSCFGRGTSIDLYWSTNGDFEVN